MILPVFCLRHYGSDDAVAVDRNQPMDQVRALLSQYPVKTRLKLTGTLIVSRDSAHAEVQERLETEGKLPDYFCNHPIYYAGPAKTPDGMASGSFGLLPPAAWIVMSNVPESWRSLVMLAKSNRSRDVREAWPPMAGSIWGLLAARRPNWRFYPQG